MCLIFAMMSSVGPWSGAGMPIESKPDRITMARASAPTDAGVQLAAPGPPGVGYSLARPRGARHRQPGRRTKEASMNVGISVPLPAYLVDVGFMARKVEELGFESFWCAEHPFIPVHSKSRFPGAADGIIPESYRHFIDPFVALARASGVTSRIKLGTGIVLVPERHPLVLAKEISSLDLFSGGRFLFGI